ncbi:hypothetical protein ES703_52991 [subsurface metagenome]
MTGEKEVEKVEGVPVEHEIIEGMPTKLTRYDRLVEDAVAERISDDEGLPKDMTARVVVGKASDGVPQLHVFGRNAEAVDAVADGIRSRDREVYRRYIGDRVSPEEEAATIRPMLADIIRSAPAEVIGSPKEFLDETLRLPMEAARGAEVVERDLGDALEGFEPGKQTKKEGGDEGAE